MKKIININLSGRVIPIEDSAYEKLQAYIESLRRYFANEEGRDEIINDIESRIAELMNEKIRTGATAITDADMGEIISSMGTVEDFEAADKETGETSSAQSESNTSYTYASKPKGRLYRDSNDKMIGGVCSGIAGYINVDPAVVRLLFAILGFATGIGFLAYIILWIVLPPKDLEGFTGRRLYRNPDEKIIGGVAGGLAAYFNKKVSTIRLIFLFPILLNILFSVLNNFRWDYGVDFALNIGLGSLSGTFILTYIVLWIVLPEASSDYQKMEMRGETVDVNRIRQNVREGMQNMKGRMKEWGQEVKQSAQNFSNKAKEFSGTSGKQFAADVRDTARRTSNGFGHVIGVLFKAFFLFVAGCIAFGLFVAFVAMIFGGVAWWPVNNFLWTSGWQKAYAWGTLIFFFGVPLIGFIVWVIRRVIKVRSRNNYLGWTFGGLWLLGWVCAVLFASSIGNDFRYWKNDGGNELSITQPAGGKMIVAVTGPELEQSGNMWWIDDESRGWDLSSDTLKLSTVKIDDIKPSIDANYHVVIKKYSYGRSADEAVNRANAIQYTVASRDSILDLGSGYAIGKAEKFRFQQVHVEIQVPVGKKIRFDESVTDKLSQVNFKIKRKKRNGFGVEIDSENDWHNNFGYETGIDYTMTEKGLQRPDGEMLKVINNSSSTIDSSAYEKEMEKLINKRKQDSIENEKRFQKEIKDLEEKRKQSKPSAYNNKLKGADIPGFDVGTSPMSSLIML